MHLNSKELIGLPVVTKSGTGLGKLASIDVDADSGRLVTLHVKTRGIVPGLMSDEVLVGWASVIEMTNERIVVADAAVTAGATAFARAKEAPSSVMAQRLT
jgi:sporulation protein YlmC with PRC-barrel domain